MVALKDVNVVCFVIWPGILENPFMHPQVFGFNFASMANDVGMLLASGIMVNMVATSKVLPTKLSSNSKKHSAKSKEQAAEDPVDLENGSGDVNPSSMESE